MTDPRPALSRRPSTHFGDDRAPHTRQPEQESREFYSVDRAEGSDLLAKFSAMTIDQSLPLRLRLDAVRYPMEETEYDQSYSISDSLDSGLGVSRLYELLGGNVSGEMSPRLAATYHRKSKYHATDIVRPQILDQCGYGLPSDRHPS